MKETERHDGLKQHAPGMALPLPNTSQTTRQDIASLELPPAPHQILTSRPSREAILGEETARSGVVVAGEGDPGAVSSIPVPQSALAVPRTGPAAATVSTARAIGLQTTAGLYTGTQLPTIVPPVYTAPQRLWDPNAVAVEQQQTAARQAAILGALHQQQQLQLQTAIALQQQAAAASTAGFIPSTAGLLAIPVMMDPSTSFLSSQALTGIESGGLSSLSSATGTNFAHQQASVMNAGSRDPDAASPKQTMRVLVTATRDVVRTSLEELDSTAVTRLVEVPRTRGRADLLIRCLNRLLPGAAVPLQLNNTAQAGGGSPQMRARESKVGWRDVCRMMSSQRIVSEKGR